jgi:hypothetical protein
MESTADSFTLFCSSGFSVSFGRFSFIDEGCVMVVVKMKKVMSRKPRSTIGVRSTRVDSFFDFLTPGPFLCPPPPEVSISAIKYQFIE